LNDQSGRCNNFHQHIHRIPVDQIRPLNFGARGNPMMPTEHQWGIPSARKDVQAPQEFALQ